MIDLSCAVLQLDRQAIHQVVVVSCEIRHEAFGDQAFTAVLKCIRPVAAKSKANRKRDEYVANCGQLTSNPEASCFFAVDRPAQVAGSAAAGTQPSFPVRTERTCAATLLHDVDTNSSSDSLEIWIGTAPKWPLAMASTSAVVE